MSVPLAAGSEARGGRRCFIKSLDALAVFTKSLAGRRHAKLTRADCLAVLEDLARLSAEQRRQALRTLPASMLRALAEEWWWQAHGGQIEPAACADGTDWRVWAIVAGRGFGKTRAGAEWVWARAREDRHARIALVGATIEEVERVMIRGESGLLALARGHERPKWHTRLGVLLFPSGAQAHAFSAARPEKLRGPQHHFAWCDELAKWPNAEDSWNNLMLGLRLGEQPRTIVTTTPKPVPLLHRILALPRCAATHGRTEDNPNLPGDFVAAMRDMFAGTRLAMQELDGVLLEGFDGALWTREMLERSRSAPAAPSPRPGEDEQARAAPGMAANVRETAAPAHGEGALAPRESADAVPPLSRSLAAGERGRAASAVEPVRFARVVVGLDPPASTGGDACGIVVCGLDEDGIGWVLADLSARGLSPEAWARRVAEAAKLYGARKVVAEKNQGGDMIASVLRAADAALPVRLVPATKSKAVRAEPVALRFETGRARLAGRFPELEDQLCALTWSGYQGPGSPDRADAMVWAMTELFERRAVPRVRML
jgi:phage terminase large subunit-like protein